ncbi:MAG TPA: serine/threonine-protein kinase [Myxococcales bacterium]|jgi:tRNA A-37 threonylcarbamoyl transferase component Bud32|nr:serine/threonine-protein kinase [Myxococcales bacterium]
MGKYRLDHRLAEGGMAEVFLATQVGPEGYEKPVVVKRVRPELASRSDFIQRFLDEARLSARLSHPNVVQTIDFGRAGEAYYLALERLDGLDLHAVVERRRAKGAPVPVDVAAAVAVAACDALDYLHGLNVLHRDLSPSNVFLTRQGVVKLLDFGIAKAPGNEVQTRSGVRPGKASYAAPEQLAGAAVDGRADLYALGAVLHEMLTLRLPDGTAPAGVPPDLLSVVDRLLEREPARRYQTPGAVRAALAELAPSDPVSLLRSFAAAELEDGAGAATVVAPPTAGTARPAPAPRSRRGLWIAVAVAAAAAVGASFAMGARSAAASVPVKVGCGQPCRVSVDGSALAPAPLELRLPPGRHRVRALLPEGEWREKDVDVRGAGANEAIWF